MVQPSVSPSVGHVEKAVGELCTILSGSVVTLFGQGSLWQTLLFDSLVSFEYAESLLKKP